jgi:hypothetical protein
MIIVDNKKKEFSHLPDEANGQVVLSHSATGGTLVIHVSELKKVRAQPHNERDPWWENYQDVLDDVAP